MKPILILPPDEMSEENIKLLRENEVCVVVAKNPAAVKFVDSVPATSSRSEMENAAIQLSRKLLSGELVGHEYKKNVAALYVELLVKGTPLDPKPSRAEVEKHEYDAARMDEVRRIAREDAREERKRAKEQKSK